MSDDVMMLELLERAALLVGECNLDMVASTAPV